MKNILSRPDLDTDEIYGLFFQGYNKGRLHYLWNAIANIVSLPPGKIRPQDNFIDLYPQSNSSSVSVEMDDLTDLVLRESNGREIPKDFKTVGAVLKFILETV